MLAVQKRAFENYFLMETGNVNQPEHFVGNKVTGILFENKCDHVYVFLLLAALHLFLAVAPKCLCAKVQEEADDDSRTYFGANPEFIEGIHMIPINPSSGYTRNQKFIKEEWATYFDNGRVDHVAGGWRGILYSNLALIDPKAAYEWFSGPNFNAQYLDNGATLTWYLALSAGLGGSP